MKNITLILAQWFGLGRLSPAPGTWGSLGAFPLIIAFHFSGLSVLSGLIILLVLFLTGIWICDQACPLLGDNKDPSSIVIDEVVGQCLALLWIPKDNFFWVWLVLGFLLFRFFDIVKPWPVSWADKRLSGGLGIMLDDVFAGLMGMLVLMGIYVAFSAVHS